MALSGERKRKHRHAVGRRISGCSGFGNSHADWNSVVPAPSRTGETSGTVRPEVYHSAQHGQPAQTNPAGTRPVPARGPRLPELFGSRTTIASFSGRQSQPVVAGPVNKAPPSDVYFLPGRGAPFRSFAVGSDGGLSSARKANRSAISWAESCFSSASGIIDNSLTR